MRLDEKLLSIFAGTTLGPLFVFVAAIGLTNLPDETELITVTSADLMDVKHAHYKRRGREMPRMCFLTREWDCVIVDAEDSHFNVLNHAVAHRRPYSIGFIRAREWFSESSERYNMVYAVTIDGRSITLMEERLMGMRIVMGSLLALGLAAIGFSIRSARALWQTRS